MFSCTEPNHQMVMLEGARAPKNIPAYNWPGAEKAMNHEISLKSNLNYADICLYVKRYEKMLFIILYYSKTGVSKLF